MSKPPLPSFEEDQGGPVRSGLAARAVLTALLLAWMAGLWMRWDELYSHAVQLSESVPVIPAVAALCLFLALNPILARLHPRLAWNRGEIILVFVIVSITPLIGSIGLMRMLLPALIAPRYFATPENFLLEVWKRLPPWFGPRNEKLILATFRGRMLNQVPWGEWLPTLLLWGAFCVALYGALLCLCVLFRRQWTERERLTYPLMQVVAELMPAPGGSGQSILRNPLLWGGISISFLYNLMHILHAFLPAFPTPGRGFDIGQYFEARPLNAIRPLSIEWRPELLGLGYLMSTEVTFSIWFSYFLLRCSRVVGTIFGVTEPYAPFPYDQEQAAGAYVALALVALYLGRKSLREVFRRAFLNDRRVEDRAEPLSYRTAVLGFLGGTAFVILFSLKAGMGLALTLLYFGFVFAFALAYTRIRAETGAPYVWLFPFWEQERMIYYLFGSEPFGGIASRPLVILASYSWLSRGYYPNSTMAVQMESFKLGDDVRMPRRHIAGALLLAIVLGLGIAYWIHLTVYYDLGAELAEGGGRVQLVLSGYQQVVDVVRGLERPPDRARSRAGGFGFLLTLLFVFLRVRFVGFPFHPLGYAMTAAYGYPLWGPALLAWLSKRLILRAGGIKLYRRCIPFFIGIILGHYFTAGVVWGVVGIFNPEVTYNYVVFFG